MTEFRIYQLAGGLGQLGICQMPGRGGDYRADLAVIAAWAPGLVLSMTSDAELAAKGAATLGADLRARGVAWRHLPVVDLAASSPALKAGWSAASAEAHQILAKGGRVLAHCMGGCGRSGMALMRLMVEGGELADHALERLRDVRACAVETEEQRAWAAVPMWDNLRRS